MICFGVSSIDFLIWQCLYPPKIIMIVKKYHQFLRTNHKILRCYHEIESGKSKACNFHTFAKDVV